MLLQARHVSQFSLNIKTKFPVFVGRYSFFFFLEDVPFFKSIAKEGWHFKGQNLFVV